jgi:diacylglycerol kinase family enzyme
VADLHLVVGNPSAQSGAAKAHLERAISGLTRRGARAELLATEPHGRTVGLVERAIRDRDPRVVVYLGGDGTFNEVARGILASGRRVPLGMLPMGTANDQGRSLGVRPGPDALEDNLDIILAGHVVELDAGRAEALDVYGALVREALFFDCIGWGIAPEILAQRNRDRVEVQEVPILREVYRDQAVYAGALLERFVASFVEPSKFAAQVVCDGRVIEYSGLTDVIVSATAIYAGEWVLDRFSEPDDGLFELVPMQGRRDWASKALRDLAILPLFQQDLDVIGATHSEGLKGARFELTFLHEGGRALASQLDGEEWVPGNRFRVTVMKNALPVITPAGFVPPWRFDRDRGH